MLAKRDRARRLADEGAAYLRETLRLDPKISEWPGEKTLPLFLREGYAFHRTRLLEAEALLMVRMRAEEPTPATLAKHMQKVREKWNHDVVFVDKAVTSLARKRLIEQGIPFIIPGNQMYLPMLGVDLREHFRKMRTARIAFSPSTQVLILDALYHPRKEADTPTASAQRFGYSTMTMTRAFDELDQAEIGIHTVKGKERRIAFQEHPRDLWDAALPYLISPVKKTTYIASHLAKGNRLRSGLSALAEYSHLSPPEAQVFAVESEEFRRIQNTEIQVWTRSPGPDLIGIELWSYPPARFGRKGIADPLSVYLSLRDAEDERVRSALNVLLLGMKW